jgi:alpha-L-fucosidase
MTSKHHEGFCMWDTKLTDYCPAKPGPKRDLVREFVDTSSGTTFNTREWRTKEMNQMVFSLQPDIVVNNHNGLPGNFSRVIRQPKNGYRFIGHQPSLPWDDQSEVSAHAGLGIALAFEQNEVGLRLSGLPQTPPGQPAAVIVLHVTVSRSSTTSKFVRSARATRWA